jgi:hypothetical protein
VARWGARGNCGSTAGPGAVVSGGQSLSSAESGGYVGEARWTWSRQRRRRPVGFAMVAVAIAVIPAAGRGSAGFVAGEGAACDWEGAARDAANCVYRSSQPGSVCACSSGLAAVSWAPSTWYAWCCRTAECRTSWARWWCWAAECRAPRAW